MLVMRPLRCSCARMLISMRSNLTPAISNYPQPARSCTQGFLVRTHHLDEIAETRLMADLSGRLLLGTAAAVDPRKRNFARQRRHAVSILTRRRVQHVLFGNAH